MTLPTASTPDLTGTTSKTIKTVYWAMTGLFALAMLMDGVAGVLREETGQQVMRQLGYPVYLLSIVGAAKMLGVIALLHPWYRPAKEWAYAGFAINFVGAAASWAFVSTDYSTLAPPLIMLVYLVVMYLVRTNYEKV